MHLKSTPQRTEYRINMSHSLRRVLVCAGSIQRVDSAVAVIVAAAVELFS